MTTDLTADKSIETVELAPNFKIPLGLFVIAGGISFTFCLGGTGDRHFRIISDDPNLSNSPTI